MSDKIVVISPSIKHTKSWSKALKLYQPDLEVEFYPNDTEREKTKFLLVWNPPEGVFKAYPNAKVISSIGAGVSHILKDPAIDESIQIVKMNNARQKKDLAVFALSLILNHTRRLETYTQYQHEHKWRRHSYLHNQAINIGIMGIGNIGQEIAALLLKNDFKVSGWSNSPKQLKFIKTFVGEKEKKAFLKTADILLCMLPLTKATKGILNREIFKNLPPKAYLINLGRGDHLVESDLLEALEKEYLSGAALDAFQEEPLPKVHPFWEHSKIKITPHTASLLDPKVVCKKIVENYNRMKNGQPLLDVIDRKKGY